MIQTIRRRTGEEGRNYQLGLEKKNRRNGESDELSDGTKATEGDKKRLKM